MRSIPRYCPFFVDRMEICKHIWAVILEVERNAYLGLAGDVPLTLQLRPDAPGSVPAGEWQTFIAEVSEKIARAERDVRPPRFREFVTSHRSASDTFRSDRTSTGTW